VIVVSDGKEYPGVSHRGAPPLHLIELQQQGKKVLPGTNLGIVAIERIGQRQADYFLKLQAWEKAVAARAEDPAAPEPGEEPEEPDTTTLAVGILAFLSIRASGERVTFEEALMRPVSFRPEPGDEPSAADPVEPPDPQTAGAEPGDEPEPSPSSGPSTTSPTPSTSGSPTSPTAGPS
jgi:hypothetical protein